MENAMSQDANAPRVIRRACIFCGSSTGTNGLYRKTAEKLGWLLARKGIGLVYGGGNIGLMGVVADAAIEGGAETIGVIPQSLLDKELAHDQLTRLHVVSSMHERKALMADLSDAFILLPGGYGSLDEFCEAITWLQLGIHSKPCGILNVEGYYDDLIRQFDRSVEDGFVRRSHRDMLIVDTEPNALLNRLYTVPVLDEVKWITDEER